jgi:sodium/hydrogen antiporter
VVRPVAGLLGLLPVGNLRPPMSGPQRWAAAFFGVRGVGSIYYLAYAAGEAEELGADWLWSTVGFTIVASVLVHGALASPVMRRVDPGTR